MEAKEARMVREHCERLILAGLSRHEVAGIIVTLLVSGTDRPSTPLADEVYRMEERLRANVISDLLIKASDAMLQRNFARASELFAQADRFS